MLAALATICLALPQGFTQPGDHEAPSGLTIVVVDVDQGDSLIIYTPDGTVHVVDGGLNGVVPTAWNARRAHVRRWYQRVQRDLYAGRGWG